MASLATKRDRLFEIAESQHGIFTTKQAVEAGFDRKTHLYQVKSGHWLREHRGIYRLAHFHVDEESEFVIWSLWSRNRQEEPQGVFSHQTALCILELSDLNPAKLHLTVPRGFRRNSAIPSHLKLHFGGLAPSEIENREGYGLTIALRTIQDLCQEDRLSRDLIAQAIEQAVSRGLITEQQRKTSSTSSDFPCWAREMFR